MADPGSKPEKGALDFDDLKVDDLDTVAGGSGVPIHGEVGSEVCERINPPTVGGLTK